MLEVIECHSQKEFETVMDNLNELANKMYNAELEYVMQNIENEVQRSIYLDWWNGGSLWSGLDKVNGDHIVADRYKCVSAKDWHDANSWILSTISKGMG